MLGLGQWVEQCNLTMLEFPVLSNRATGSSNHRVKIYVYLFSLSLSHLPSPLNALHSLLVVVLFHHCLFADVLILGGSSWMEI